MDRKSAMDLLSSLSDVDMTTWRSLVKRPRLLTLLALVFSEAAADPLSAREVMDALAAKATASTSEDPAAAAEKILQAALKGPA